MEMGLYIWSLETCGAMKWLSRRMNASVAFNEEAVKVTKVYEFVLSTFGCLKSVKKL